MVLGFDDTISRLGGDEFLVVFPGKKAIEAMRIFEPVHSYIQEVKAQYSLPYNMGISAGVFQYKEGLGVDEFIDIADSKMYEEKMRLRKRG